VIIETSELPRLAGKVAMVSGGFDPLHPGHIIYFRAAAELGFPLLCNVSNDRFVAKKHAPLLLERERIDIIDEFRCVTYTHLAREGTVEVLRLLRPALYVKGQDWAGRLPQEELLACEESGARVAFLDTVTNSSSGILERYTAAQGERAIRALAEQRA